MRSAAATLVLESGGPLETGDALGLVPTGLLDLAVTGDEQLELAVRLVRPGVEVVTRGLGHPERTGHPGRTGSTGGAGRVGRQGRVVRGGVVVSHAEAFVAGQGGVVVRG